MTQRSNPALSKPVGGKSLPGLHYEIGRARSAFHQGPKLCASRKAEYIGADRLSLSFFACEKAADHTSRLSVIWESSKGCPTWNDRFRHIDFRYS